MLNSQMEASLPPGSGRGVLGGEGFAAALCKGLAHTGLVFRAYPNNPSRSISAQPLKVLSGVVGFSHFCDIYAKYWSRGLLEVGFRPKLSSGFQNPNAYLEGRGTY